jgi:hypothetical protein
MYLLVLRKKDEWLFDQDKKINFKKFFLSIIENIIIKIENSLSVA